MQKIKYFLKKYRFGMVFTILLIYMLLLGLGAIEKLIKIDCMLK